MKKIHLLENKLNEGIEYCKQNNIKYLPFYFPNMLSGRDSSYNTGIEIETQKKYCCIKMGNLHYLYYLEDKPHKVWRNTGVYEEYDAVKDGLGLQFIDGYTLQTSTNEHATQSYYITKKYEITEDEYVKRTTALENYPYEYYQVRRRF